MNVTNARAALASLVATATGLPAGSIFWANRPRGWTGPAYAVLRLNAYVSRGRDQIRYDYDATRALGEEIEPHQVGLREIMWEVQVWSHAAIDATDALSYASALRDRLHLDEVRDALFAVEIGVADVAGFRAIDVIQDGREMSVCALDVRLNTVANTAGTRLGYVEQWGVEGTATMADGSTPTIVDEVMP